MRKILLQLPTCKEVYDALQSGITERWNIIAAKGGSLHASGVATCKLCTLFLDTNGVCDGCPLDLIGQRCHADNSLWEAVVLAPTKAKRKEAAKNMLQTLIELRDFYFDEGWELRSEWD